MREVLLVAVGGLLGSLSGLAAGFLFESAHIALNRDRRALLVERIKEKGFVRAVDDYLKADA